MRVFVVSSRGTYKTETSLNLCGWNLIRTWSFTLSSWFFSFCHTTATKLDKSDHIVVDYARIRWSTAFHSISCWIMSVGLSAWGSRNPLQPRLGQYESVPQATGAALPSLGQLSTRHYCLHAHYCSQNKRSTCLAIPEIHTELLVCHVSATRPHCVRQLTTRQVWRGGRRVCGGCEF